MKLLSNSWDDRALETRANKEAIPLPEDDYGQEVWLRYRLASPSYRESLEHMLGPLEICPEWRHDCVAESAIAEWDRARSSMFRPPQHAWPVCCELDPAMPREANQLFRTDQGFGFRASDPHGLLYGVFRLIRLLQMRIPVGLLPACDTPAVSLRVINHWDNIYPRCDIERGYGGRSIFHWEELPKLRPRYTEYARLLASIGVNGIILNNVNAGEPQVGGWRLLEDEFLPKLRALAGVFRAWGIRIGISVSYSSPMLCGELGSDDPRDARVAVWWARRTQKIYEAIPDFLGYLIKADSEGQSGPVKHGLNHAEGSRVIADALAPHGGRLFWRAFIYKMRGDIDLVAQPYTQFKPLDGAFPPNVSIQIKYGPRDFQPREPIHPLLGCLEKTATTLELQITQEYLGHDVHAVFLPSLWEEILQTSVTLAPTLAEFLASSPDAAFAGVSNVSETPNWTSHLFAQANLYGFGRMAWDPDIRAERIAREWTALTFDNNPRATVVASSILLNSHRLFVGYTVPFCLGQVHGNADSWERCHLDPDPAAKNGSELFCANATGIGIDRPLKAKSGVFAQYPAPLAELYRDPSLCPENVLLWFHHLPWDWKMRDGRTLLQAICDSYSQAALEAETFPALWNTLRHEVIGPRFEQTLRRFFAQSRHARLWARHMTSYIKQCAEGATVCATTESAPR